MKLQNFHEPLNTEQKFKSIGRMGYFVLSEMKILINLFLKSEKLEYQEHKADVEIVCADGSIVVSL